MLDFTSVQIRKFPMMANMQSNIQTIPNTVLKLNVAEMTLNLFVDWQTTDLRVCHLISLHGQFNTSGLNWIKQHQKSLIEPGNENLEQESVRSFLTLWGPRDIYVQYILLHTLSALVFKIDLISILVSKEGVFYVLHLFIFVWVAPLVLDQSEKLPNGKTFWFLWCSIEMWSFVSYSWDNCMLLFSLFVSKIHCFS